MPTEATFLKKYQRSPVQEIDLGCCESPTVSVVVPTYNHERFISKCIESILSQKTSFKFEILIGEDESQDNTRAICMNLVRQWPKQIRLFLNKRVNNIHIKGYPTDRFNFLYCLTQARGEFIALCDGDDVWCNDHKLELQVSKLIENNGASVCIHDVDHIDENGDTLKRNASIANSMGRTLIPSHVALTSHYFANTLAMVFRNNLIVPEWMVEFPYADKSLFKLISIQGNSIYINNVLGCYRISPNSISHSPLFHDRTSTVVIKENIRLHELLLPLAKNTTQKDALVQHIAFLKIIYAIASKTSTFSKVIYLVLNAWRFSRPKKDRFIHAFRVATEESIAWKTSKRIFRKACGAIGPWRN